jgi:hypothetical protein
MSRTAETLFAGALLGYMLPLPTFFITAMYLLARANWNATWTEYANKLTQNPVIVSYAFAFLKKEDEGPRIEEWEGRFEDHPA